MNGRKQKDKAILCACDEQAEDDTDVSDLSALRAQADLPI